MSEGRVTLNKSSHVAHVTFDRPAARNAMTWRMYEDLAEICTTLADDPDVRCVTFRGAGGKAFVAGTDISQFAEFKGAADGIDYEARIEQYLGPLDALNVPTLAVVEGWAIGGGLAITALCDLRIATPDARFGVPIARTLGNCLSIRNLARLSDQFGVARVKRMLLLADTIDADEALNCGYLSAISEANTLDDMVETLAEKLVTHAPVTMHVTKEALRRLQGSTPDDEDLVALCYGSKDFKIGVAAFNAKTKPLWEGK
jgi:enoyl-CoA hydratase